MPRPTDSGAETRQRALEIAAELIAERGYAATSLREIAERLRVTKAALYYHFSSKDDLVAALVAPVLEGLDRFLDEAERDALPAEVVAGRAAGLAFAAPGAAAIFGDPALRPGGTHDLGFGERRRRLARAMAGPGASTERILRAHAALGAVEALVEAVADLGPESGVSFDADLQPLALRTALATLGDDV